MPKFAEITSADVIPAIQTNLKEFNESFSALEAELTRKGGNKPSYASVVEKLEIIQAPLAYTWGVTGHLMGVKNSEDLRKAHETVEPEIVKQQQQLGQSKPVFDALNAIKNSVDEWKSLERAQQRIIESNIRQMQNSGIGLTGETREKFNKLQLEVEELSTKFSNNVLDSTKQFSLVITDASKIEGLPESARAAAAQKAKVKGHENAWILTLDPPSYLSSMQHLKDRELRETLYKAFVTRASSGSHNNEENIRRILQLKKEIAVLLGYSCYAEVSLSSKMAPSVSKVVEFIDMLRDRSYPAAQRDIADLQEFANSKGFIGDLALWDVPFWAERMRESLYNYEEEQLKPYFALPSVLDGLFLLANRLFGIKIEAADGQVQVWNNDVKFFNVRDAKSGNLIASFYLDPYSRPEDKRGGAWMNVCLGRSRVLNRIPVAYLTCNGSPPIGDKPSLMTFREVETLFHEFGHGLQHMLTNVEHGEAAGINNVEWDAVELPSQFMENFCYDKKTIYGFAKHYQTGEPLPLELFEKLTAAKNFQAGAMMMRQLSFAAVDMELHSNYDPYGTKSPFDVQRDLAKKYAILQPLPTDRFLCAFSHIFAGGYSAGYYSYKWAEVMSADAFSAFEEIGLDNEVKVKETGMRFRDTVLGLGGGEAAATVFQKFRGRDPNSDALLRHSGLAKK